MLISVAILLLTARGFYLAFFIAQEKETVNFTHMEKRSYYNYIQSIIEGLDKVYEDVGALRDAADTNEKQIYNDTRGALGSLASSWRSFQNRLPQKRAEMLL